MEKDTIGLRSEQSVVERTVFGISVQYVTTDIQIVSYFKLLSLRRTGSLNVIEILSSEYEDRNAGLISE